MGWGRMGEGDAAPGDPNPSLLAESSDKARPSGLCAGVSMFSFGLKRGNQAWSAPSASSCPAAGRRGGAKGIINSGAGGVSIPRGGIAPVRCDADDAYSAIRILPRARRRVRAMLE